MGRNLLLVGLGGFLGSAGRYLTTFILSRFFSITFPLGTFTVNIIGCFVIGLVYGISGQANWLTPHWRLLITTGFCGGYTTFSTFTLENADMIQTGNYGMFALYTIGSFAVGLLAVFLGLMITKI